MIMPEELDKPRIASYPEDFLNEQQKAFRDRIASFGAHGVNSDEFNRILGEFKLSAEDWRKMVDLNIFDYKRLALEDRCMIKSLLANSGTNKGIIDES